MRDRFSGPLIAVAIAAAAVSAVTSMSITRTSAQAPTASATAPAPAPALKTPWGEPDLQGIWTDENDTPFQRSPKYANREFFTDAERAEFDVLRSTLRGRDNRGDRGSERDVSGAYNNVWGGLKRTSARTSMIVDPPDGRIPPLVPEAQKTASADRDFRNVLMRATQTCKLQLPGCVGGRYD